MTKGERGEEDEKEKEFGRYYRRLSNINILSITVDYHLQSNHNWCRDRSSWISLFLVFTGVKIYLMGSISSFICPCRDVFGERERKGRKRGVGGKGKDEERRVCDLFIFFCSHHARTITKKMNKKYLCIINQSKRCQNYSF